MKKLFIPYYRVSTDQQGESGLGLMAQRRFVEQYVDSVKGAIIDEYTDVESGKKLDIVGLHKAIGQCAKLGAVLVVSDIDRLSRAGFSALSIIEQSGVDYVESKSPNDTSLVKGIKFLIAKDERDKISSRTKNALAELKMSGVKLGRPENFSNEGRMKGGIANRIKAIENEANKRAGFMIVKLREENISFDNIVNQLNQNGYRTSTGAEFQKGSAYRLYKRTISILDEKKLSFDNIF